MLVVRRTRNGNSVPGAARALFAVRRRFRMWLWAMLGLAIVMPAAASDYPQNLAFLLAGERAGCTGFYWRANLREPGHAYFLSAGHCWQQRYVKPREAKVLWATVSDNRPSFIDVLIGETPDERPVPTYPQEFLDEPTVGDAYTSIAMRVGVEPTFETFRLTFKRNLGDAYEYEADRCLAPGYSGAPVLTEDGRLVGVAILRDRRFCNRVYAFPMQLLYMLRPDLHP